MVPWHFRNCNFLEKKTASSYVQKIKILRQLTATDFSITKLHCKIVTIFLSFLLLYCYYCTHVGKLLSSRFFSFFGIKLRPKSSKLFSASPLAFVAVCLQSCFYGIRPASPGGEGGLQEWREGRYEKKKCNRKCGKQGIKE